VKKNIFIFGLLISISGYLYADFCSSCATSVSSGDCSAEVALFRECLCDLSDRVNDIYNNPRFVWNSDEVGGVITLSESGSYRAGEDLIYPVEINGDKICFDLNCKELRSDYGATNIVTVKSGKKAARIFNGCIRNTDIPLGQGAGAGVLLEQNAESVQVDNINIFTCGVGVNLVGTSGNEVKECEFFSLNIIGTTTGVLSTYGDNNVYNDCHVFESLVYGFNFVTSNNNCIVDCKAIDITGAATVAGFRSENGENNLFQGCVAKDIETTGTDFGAIAYGIVLSELEKNTKIIDCIISDVSATESSWSHGIFLEPEIDGSLFGDIGYTADDNNIAYGPKPFWSPDERYIAVSDATALRIYKLDEDGTALDLVSSITHDIVSSASWSPDGKFLAVAYEHTTLRIGVYRFKGTQLDTPEVIYDSSELAADYGWFDLDWSENGKFIIASSIIGNNSSGLLRVFIFDGSGLTVNLTLVDSLSVTDSTLCISPCSGFIATADRNSDSVSVYSFDGTSLGFKATISPGVDPTSRWIEWSPNGGYILMVGSTRLRVHHYDTTTNTLTEIDDAVIGGVNNSSCGWSPNNEYIVVGRNDAVLIYFFNGSEISFYDLFTFVSPFSEWSPSGRYIVLGGLNPTPHTTIRAAMHSPGGIFMKNNIVSMVNAHGDTVGTGIMHSGGWDVYNFISGSGVQNVCSSNEANFGFGIPNTFWGNHNIDRPGSNISMPLIP